MNVQDLVMRNRVIFHMFLREYFADCDPDLWALVAGLAPSEKTPYLVLGEGEIYLQMWTELRELLERYGYHAKDNELGMLVHMLRTFG